MWGASTAPWWGVAIISGAFLLLGSAITKGVDVWNDRRKEKTRWDNDRRQAALHLLAATGEHIEAAAAIRLRQAEIDINVSVRAIHAALAELALVSGPDVRTTADKLKETAIGYAAALEHGENPSPGRKSYLTAYDEFIDVVRKALGIRVDS